MTLSALEGRSSPVLYCKPDIKFSTLVAPMKYYSGTKNCHVTTFHHPMLAQNKL